MKEVKQKRMLHMIVKKTEKGSYQAVLSSDSIDCDDEIVGSGLLKLWGSTGFVLPMLTDHVNSIDNLVGQWINKQVISNDTGTYLYAEPQFISKCNPRGDKIKATLDDDIPLGVSIGFWPTESKEVTIDGKTVTEWTEGKLLEASWTPIPANSDAYGYVSKSLKIINSISTKKDSNGENMAKKDAKTKTPDATAEPAAPTEPMTDPVTPSSPADDTDNEPDKKETSETDEPVGDAPEKSVDIQSIVNKATKDMTDKFTKAIKTIEALEKSNTALKTRIDKLETAPVHRALVDNPNQEKSQDTDIKQEDLSMSKTIFAQAQQ